MKRVLTGRCRSVRDHNPFTPTGRAAFSGAGGRIAINNPLKILVTCAATILILSFPWPREAWSAEFITGSGCSISNVGYLSALAREFERRTGMRVFVRGGGSVVGLEDLKDGNVDFAASCRGRMPDDPRDIQFVQVAWDALVFIVHQNNPVSNISLDEVRSVYSGRITNWRKLGGHDGPIELFVARSRRGLSGVGQSLRHLVLDGRAVRSPNARFVASSGIVEQLVEKTPGGFAATGFTSARKRKVKILKVNGVYPTVKNIINGEYGLKRPLFLVIPPNPKPEVVRFLSFALSEEGQHFISSQGVVSLLDLKRGRSR